VSRLDLLILLVGFCSVELVGATIACDCVQLFAFEGFSWERVLMFSVPLFLLNIIMSHSVVIVSVGFDLYFVIVVHVYVCVGAKL